MLHLRKARGKFNNFSINCVSNFDYVLNVLIFFLNKFSTLHAFLFEIFLYISVQDRILLFHWTWYTNYYIYTLHVVELAFTVEKKMDP